MTKWEYKVINFETGGFLGGRVNAQDVETRLNELGKLGWELVSAYSSNMGYGATRNVIYNFKKASEF